MRLVFKNKNNGFVSMQRFLHGVVYASFSLFFVLFIATLIPVYNTVDKAEAAVGTSTESKITFTSTRHQLVMKKQPFLFLLITILAIH